MRQPCEGDMYLEKEGERKVLVDFIGHGIVYYRVSKNKALLGAYRMPIREFTQQTKRLTYLVEGK